MSAAFEARRLWCEPHDDHLVEVMETVIERIWDNMEGDEYMDRTFTIEEWNLHPPLYHLPSAELILEYIGDLADDTETDEGWGEEFDRVQALPIVTEAVERVRSTIAANFNYFMANEKVAEHAMSFATVEIPVPEGADVDENGEPLDPAPQPTQQKQLMIDGLAKYNIVQRENGEYLEVVDE